MKLRDQKKIVREKELFRFHGLGPLACADSNSTSEIMNHF
jgi:hypothetical protein